MNKLGSSPAAIGATLLAGCALLQGPRSYTLSEAELASRLAERFPVDRTIAQMIDLRIDAPRVTLKPQDNRIGIDVQMALTDPLTKRPLPVALALDSGLRFDAAQAAVLLSDVRIRRFAVDGLPESIAAPVQRFGAPLVEQIIEGSVVHRFSAEQLQRAGGRGAQPDAIDVTPQGVRITLQPR